MEIKTPLKQVDGCQPLAQQCPRPLSFYGPDDWDGYTPWEEIDAAIRARQHAWDASYKALPWWARLKVALSGGVTEPVGTSCGMPM